MKSKLNTKNMEKINDEKKLVDYHTHFLVE